MAPSMPHAPQHASCSSEKKAWAGLKDATLDISVSDFIDRVFGGDTQDDIQGEGPEDMYAGRHTAQGEGPEMLFDMSMPKRCPELAEAFVIPRYFAGDLMQRTPPANATPVASTVFREAWPSLFVAPGSTGGKLHVDTLGTNFWQLVIEGQKTWVFFERQDGPLLSPDYLEKDWGFDAMRPNYTRFPAARWAQRYEAVLGPGDAIFVPAGSPHQVRNDVPTIALAGNYIDGSNLEYAKEELTSYLLKPKKAGDHHRPEAEALLHHFNREGFNTQPNMQQTDMAWGEYKNQWRMYR